MATFTVDANPEVLEWARQSIGLARDEAAKKIGIDNLTLRYWEEGVETEDIKGPTISQLRKMAEAYKQPLGALLLPEPPPTDSGVKTDFRLLPQNQNKSWSSELRLALRRVQMQRSITEELLEAEGEVPPPPELPISLNQDPEPVSVTVRQWLGDQPRQSSSQSYLRQWTELIENKNILVTQVQRVKLEEMRGCSISDVPFPAIVLNGSDSQNGKVFTLMHELIHILLRSGGLCDLEDRMRHVSNDKERVERFCNQVAAALLMPRDELRSLLRGRSPRDVVSDQFLRNLAEQFGVSREALLLRLVSLDWVPWDYYFEMKPHFEELYAERRRAKVEKKEGGPTYYTMKIRDLGRRYISTVLDAYYRQDITNADLARYLGVKANKVSALESSLGDRR